MKIRARSILLVIPALTVLAFAVSANGQPAHPKENVGIVETIARSESAITGLFFIVGMGALTLAVNRVHGEIDPLFRKIEGKLDELQISVAGLKSELAIHVATIEQRVAVQERDIEALRGQITEMRADTLEHTKAIEEKFEKSMNGLRTSVIAECHNAHYLIQSNVVKEVISLLKDKKND